MKIKLIQLILLLFVFVGGANAQKTWTNGNASGNWEDDDNWSPAGAPTETDAVIFDGTSTDDCFVTSAALAATVTVSSSYTGTLEIADGATLTCSGNFSTAGATSFTFVVNGEFYTGQLTATAGIINASGADVFECDADIGGTGGFNINGSTFTAPSGQITVVLGSGTFTSRTSGTFNANGGTFRLSFRANKTFPSGFTGTNAFNNLRIAQSGASTRTLTLGGNVEVAGTLTLVSAATEALNFGGNFSIDVSGGLDVSNNSATGGSGTTSGTATTAIRLVGNTSQTITGLNSTSNGGVLPNLVINQGSSGSVVLTDRINLGRNLTINSNGTITCQSGSVIGFLNSAVDATISGSTTQTNIDLQDLIINKTGRNVSLSGFTPNIRINGVMTIPAGTYTTGSKLIFRSSSASSSGQLGVVSGTLSGTATVERFIPGSTGRKWRFLASSVTTSNGIDDNWQQQIHITGSGTGGTTCPTLTANSNGFDATLSNSPSIYTYNESTASWASISSTTGDNLTRGVGYRVFVRGPRTQGCSLLDGTNPTPNDVTLSATGSLATGTQTINVTNGTGSGWNLLGNPFQAIIDWDNVGRTNVSSFYQTFNPIAGINGVGAYGTYTAGGSGTNNVTRYISPGQAFWVQATGTGSIAIEEADKAVTQTGAATVLFKTGGENRLSIKVLDASNYSDEVIVLFSSSATKCLDANLDVEKLQFSSGVGNIATYNSCSGMRYSINTLPTLANGVIDTISLHIKLPTNTSANYRLAFDGLYVIDNSKDVYLHDSYLNTYYNIRTNSTYNFATIANNAATQGASRFELIIGNNLTALPVKLTNFTASRVSNQSKLSWKTASEVNSEAFIIERSIDAERYEAIGVVAAKGNSAVGIDYHFTDLNPAFGQNNYYRLKMVDRGGKSVYSNIQIVSFRDEIQENTSLVTSVYPVPANDHVLLTLASDINSELSYRIYDVAGNLINETNGVQVNREDQLMINLNSNMTTGLYFIEVADAFGNVQRVKFIKN